MKLTYDTKKGSFNLFDEYGELLVTGFTEEIEIEVDGEEHDLLEKKR